MRLIPVRRKDFGQRADFLAKLCSILSNNGLVSGIGVA
jgi:hypothetical protein